MDHYKTLGIKRSASIEEIRAVYKVLAKKYHPDVYEGDKEFAERKMQDINYAYGVLSNVRKREMYDLSLSDERTASAGADRDRSRQQRKSAAPAQKKKKPAAARQKASGSRSASQGKVEIWTTRLGKAAVIASAALWFVYFMIASNTTVMFVSYSVFIIVSIVLFGFVRADANVDVFMLSLIFAIAYSLVYDVVYIVFFSEIFSFTEHILVVPLISCTLSLLPATIALKIIQFSRKKKSGQKTA